MRSERPPSNAPARPPSTGAPPITTAPHIAAMGIAALLATHCPGIARAQTPEQSQTKDTPANASAADTQHPSIHQTEPPARDQTYPFNIPPGDLPTTLAAISAITQLSIITAAPDVQNLSAPAIQGQLSADQALTLALAQTRLTAMPQSGGFIVMPSPTLPTPTTPGPTSPPAASMIANERIIVTGYRTSNAASIGAKRDASGIVDVVHQGQIGLLPDLTLSQVARRLPGIAAVPASGGSGTRAVETAEAAVIRGMQPSYNLVTFDGVPIAATSEDERAANLSLFPTTIAERVEVIKTLSADLPPHGLSGQLNFVTASAVQSPYTNRSHLVASWGQDTTAGRLSNTTDANARLDGFHARRWGNRDQFGLVISGSWEKFQSTSFDHRPGAESATYLFFPADPTSNTAVDTFAASNGFPAARRNQLYLFEHSQRRGSLAGKLEYRPHDDTTASLFIGLFAQDENETRHEHLAVANLEFRPNNQTLTSGSWPQGRFDTGYVDQPEDSVTGVITSQLSRTINTTGQLDITASYSRAQVDIARNMSKFAASYSADTSFTYELSSGDAVIDFINPDAANDLTTHQNAYIRARTETMSQDLAYFNASYGHNFKRPGLGAQIGATLTRRDQVFDSTYIEGDVFNTVGCSAVDITDCPLATLDAYVLPPVVSTTDPNIAFYLIDDAALRADWARQGMPITQDRTGNSIASDYTIEEHLGAVYAQASAHAGPLTAQAGLRHDVTRTKSNVFALDAAQPDTGRDADQYIPVSRTNTYSLWLPSVLVRYDIQNNVTIRASYGRTIGRPNFADLARTETIGIPTPSGEIDITRANPDLKPLISDNLDLSVEYYFDGGSSLLSGAVFYKDVSDLIFVSRTVQNDFAYDDHTYIATITQPVNATDASIQGLELALRKTFSDTFEGVLAGIIIDANMTWLESDYTTINAAGEARDPGGWINQPETLANAQIAWEGDRLSAKLGYTYVGAYLSNILADEGDLYDMYARPRAEWDVQTRMRLTDTATIIAEVQNLTEEGLEFERRFPNTTLLGTSAERGRIAWLGIRITL